jgi:hypothetical protein
MLIDCTTSEGAVAAGEFCTLVQKIEGYNFLPLAQRTFTLSFWVKATKTGTYCVSFANGGNDRSYVAEYTISSSDTWEFKTITVTASPSAGTWDYTNDKGLRVYFTMFAGSTFQTTAGSWQTGQFLATANQVNGADSTNNNFRITGLQIEAGSVATDFEYVHFQDQLARCQRYFCKTFSYNTTPAQGVDDVNGCIASDYAYANAAGVVGTWSFPVTMRTVPTITTYNPWEANANWRNTGNSADANLGATNPGHQGCRFQGDTNTVAGTSYQIHATANAEL